MIIKRFFLSINGIIAGCKIKKGFIEFKNDSQQILAPFRIHADKVDKKTFNGSYTEKYQDHIPCSFSNKIVCVDDKFIMPILLYKGENAP